MNESEIRAEISTEVSGGTKTPKTISEVREG
jgi:hypothetical protein